MYLRSGHAVEGSGVDMDVVSSCTWSFESPGPISHNSKHQVAQLGLGQKNPHRIGELELKASHRGTHTACTD